MIVIYNDIIIFVNQTSESTRYTIIIFIKGCPQHHDNEVQIIQIDGAVMQVRSGSKWVSLFT